MRYTRTISLVENSARFTSLANCAYMSEDDSSITPARQDGGTTIYWTSSAGRSFDGADIVYIDGSVFSDGINRVEYSVRPALLFNL